MTGASNAASKCIESDTMDYLAIGDTVVLRGLIMEALLWFLTGWQLCTAEVWSEPELPTLSELQPSELLKFQYMLILIVNLCVAANKEY